MESQSHGNEFEDKVIQAITGLTKNEYQKLLEGSYTSSLDLVKDKHVDFNASIKSTGGDNIGGGDILRFYNHSKTGFKLIVGIHKQVSESEKEFNAIYEFDLCPDDFPKLWGNIPESTLKEFNDYVKSIPPGKEAQTANKKLWKQKRQSIYDNNTQGIVKIDAKIDSKNQRRVQCGFKISQLIESGITHNKYTEEYYSIKLPYRIYSEKRKRNSEKT